MTDSKSSQLVNKLAQRLLTSGINLVTAESCTGGGIAQACTSVSGSSQWFERGFVTYSNASKVELLNVQPSTLDQNGAVSSMTVIEMLKGALANSHAQLGLAVSGIAGPGGGSEEKPVGTVWFSWGTSDKQMTSEQVFSGDRQQIQQQAIEFALGVLASWSDE